MALSMPAIMKTTAARLSALYLLLFAICAVLLVFYMTSLSARMLTGQTQETINDEVLGLARVYQRGGYRRFGEGELERQRNPIADPNEPSQSEVQVEGEKGHNAIALVLRLPNQMIMLVGRDLGEPERFRAVIRRALTLALGMMALGGILIWFFVGRAALKRIDSVSQASRRILGGDLSGRLPVTGAGDEFDRLSENLNSMLARIATLNEGLKQVSDN
ncbi:MAG: HAMP domain-containing protein, partial [Mesorhizobium sp.]